ncbi:MBL fold metallo-hydrolase [Desulfovibrio cuneatus]|uniref:MBL fold metallo-hydrolase n=1 Tax=Desulfovibrio cuneatus TaxID=159728 RepID=UPI0003F68504|nr:MBL fold metallo-hydrolase [Desulfovibrio cuneatus]
MHTPNVRGFFDPATATWTYVVWSTNNAVAQCAVIDSVLDYDIYSCTTKTTSADAVIDFIQEKRLSLQWILETHIHADHITAAHYLQQKLGGTIAISKHILAIVHTWEAYFQNSADTPQDGRQFDHLFEDDEEFTIADLPAKIMYTPGHTPADTSYIIGNAVFVGDAMFLPDVGSGRCDFPGGSAEDAYDSSRKLLALPGDYRMYVGHDYPPEGMRGPRCMATIDQQQQTNNRLSYSVDKHSFIARRNADDTGKPVPHLLLPSIQANLRAGQFGEAVNGVQFVKLPVNML